MHWNLDLQHGTNQDANVSKAREEPSMWDDYRIYLRMTRMMGLWSTWTSSMFTINCSPVSYVVTKNPTGSPWFTYGMRNVRAIEAMVFCWWCCRCIVVLQQRLSLSWFLARAVPSVIDIHILSGGQSLVRSGSGNLPLSAEIFELKEEREKELTVNISCFHSFRVRIFFLKKAPNEYRLWRRWQSKQKKHTGIAEHNLFISNTAFFSLHILSLS